MNITLIDVLEFVGTYAFAISGIRLAAGKKFDWFGAYIVGFVTAVGGGTIRDIMLGLPPFWMENSIYMIETFVAFVTVLLFSKYLVSQDSTLFLFDTLGLALFTVVGIEKTLGADYPLWMGIVMGSITGAAGGVIRDVLINEVPLVFRKDIYAMACIFGGVVYGICLWLGLDSQVTPLVAGCSVFILRYFSDAKHISLPVLNDPMIHLKDNPTDCGNPSENNPSAS